MAPPEPTDPNRITIRSAGVILLISLVLWSAIAYAVHKGLS